MVAVIAIIGWLVLVFICAQYNRRAGQAVLMLPAALVCVWLVAVVAGAGAHVGWGLVR